MELSQCLRNLSEFVLDDVSLVNHQVAEVNSSQGIVELVTLDHFVRGYNAVVVRNVRQDCASHPVALGAVSRVQLDGAERRTPSTKFSHPTREHGHWANYKKWTIHAFHVLE